ncbi:unnamed protein product, partial [Ectocarpus fasciculatus]
HFCTYDPSWRARVLHVELSRDIERVATTSSIVMPFWLACDRVESYATRLPAAWLSWILVLSYGIWTLYHPIFCHSTLHGFSCRLDVVPGFVCFRLLCFIFCARVPTCSCPPLPPGPRFPSLSALDLSVHAKSFVVFPLVLTPYAKVC